MGGFLLEQWHWWTITLLACTFAFAFRGSKLAWAAIGSTVVGGILWFKPDFPAMYQIGIFIVITTLGAALTTVLTKNSTTDSEGDERGEPKMVLRVDRLIGYVITLETPIVNGSGSFEIQGVTLRIRGADCAAGEKVKVVGVDGIDRERLMVEPVEGGEGSGAG